MLVSGAFSSFMVKKISRRLGTKVRSLMPTSVYLTTQLLLFFIIFFFLEKRFVSSIFEPYWPSTRLGDLLSALIESGSNLSNSRPHSSFGFTCFCHLKFQVYRFCKLLNGAEFNCFLFLKRFFYIFCTKWASQAPKYPISPNFSLLMTFIFPSVINQSYILRVLYTD